MDEYQQTIKLVRANDLAAIKLLNFAWHIYGFASEAAKLGHFEMLRYFKKEGYDLYNTWEDALLGKQFAVLIWLHSIGVKIDRTTELYDRTWADESFCDPEMRAWLVENAAPYDIKAIIRASDVEALDEWHDNEVEISFTTDLTTLAIEVGNIEVLELLREWGFPWPKFATTLTSDPAILEWMMKPRDIHTTQHADEDVYIHGFIVTNL